MKRDPFERRTFHCTHAYSVAIGMHRVHMNLLLVSNRHLVNTRTHTDPININKYDNDAFDRSSVREANGTDSLYIRKQQILNQNETENEKKLKQTTIKSDTIWTRKSFNSI